MKQTSLIVEFLIIGTIGLVNLGLLFMIIFKVDTDQIQVNIEENKELIIPIGTFMIYILGAIIHRVGGLIGYVDLAGIADKMKLKYPKRDDSFQEKYHAVYQFGSEHVMERVFYTESMLRLFKSGTILFFILGILSFLWAIRLNKDIWTGIFVLSTCIIISILCLISHSSQSKSFERFIHGINSTISKNPDSKNGK